MKIRISAFSNIKGYSLAIPGTHTLLYKCVFMDMIILEGLDGGELKKIMEYVLEDSLMTKLFLWKVIKT